MAKAKEGEKAKGKAKVKQSFTDPSSVPNYTHTHIRNRKRSGTNYYSLMCQTPHSALPDQIWLVNPSFPQPEESKAKDNNEEEEEEGPKESAAEDENGEEEEEEEGEEESEAEDYNKKAAEQKAAELAIVALNI